MKYIDKMNYTDKRQDSSADFGSGFHNLRCIWFNLCIGGWLFEEIPCNWRGLHS